MENHYNQPSTRPPNEATQEALVTSLNLQDLRVCARLATATATLEQATNLDARRINKPAIDALTEADD